MKYRKKPVEIEAIQFWNGNGPNTILECIRFTNHKATFNEKDLKLEIDTLEGKMCADDGDWIIKGVAGEFYPCRDDIFQKTYEKVD